MKKVLFLDAKNYEESMEEILRTAVRGVAFIEGKLLLIEDNFGEVKLPGGGIDKGEDDLTALCREVKEETGFTVIPESVVPFGEVEEKRLSTKESMIWHQISRLYFCDVETQQGECSYTDHEKRYGFRQVLYTIDEAIEKNQIMLQKEGIQPWNQREYKTLLVIKEYFDKKRN